VLKEDDADNFRDFVDLRIGLFEAFSNTLTWKETHISIPTVPEGCNEETHAAAAAL